MKKIITSLFIAVLILNCFAQPGTLDSTFGNGGKVITDLGSGEDRSNSVALQNDGKIVIAGYKYISNSNYDFALVRYNSNGSLDSTFGSGGKIITSFGNADDRGRSIVIQSDEKIVIAGYSGSGTNYDFALIRYLSDGTLDSSFGTGGKVTTDFGNSADRSNSMAIQSDGKLIVAGYSSNGTNTDFALARYNDDGTLDNSFSSVGKVSTDFGSNTDECTSVAIQSDGKIVAIGRSGSPANYDFALVRYNSDGIMDNSFGSGGKITTAIGTSWDVGFSIAIQNDGKILVAGESKIGNYVNFALVRYNSNGNLDNTFGNGGKVITDFGAATNAYGASVAIQTDSKIVVAGTNKNGIREFALVRYNSNGTLDNTFDSDGKITTAIGSSWNFCYSVVIQNDNKIVAAGYSNSGGSSYDDFTVARYNSDGSTDVSTVAKKNIEMKIFPNPASSTLIFSFQNQIPTQLIITNIFGQLVFKTTEIKSNEMTLDVNDFPKGIYFYQLKNEKQEVSTGKFIIQ